MVKTTHNIYGFPKKAPLILYNFNWRIITNICISRNPKCHYFHISHPIYA